MATHVQPPVEPTTEEQSRRERRIGGIALVALGAFFLLAQFVNLGVWVLPILGLGFLSVGVLTKQAGWMIPGGILSGLALGVFTVENPLSKDNPVAGGLFLIAFAAGWALIYVASRLFTNNPQRWALIPAGIMAGIGAMAYVAEFTGPSIRLFFRLLNVGWPLILVAIGVNLLVREWRRR